MLCMRQSGLCISCRKYWPIDPEFLNIFTEFSLSNQQYQKVYEVDAV